MEIFHCAALRRAAPIIPGNFARARFIVRWRVACRALDSLRSFSPVASHYGAESIARRFVDRVFVAEGAHRAHHSDRASGRLAEGYFRKSGVRHEKRPRPVAGALLDLPAPGLHRAVGERKERIY